MTLSFVTGGLLFVSDSIFFQISLSCLAYQY